MRLVTPPLVVEEDDGFKNDILERKAYGEALLNLVTRSNDELVISLDGEWGEGKTTFVKMWQGLLNEADIPNIYIDAFANDYIDDAFTAVASAITSYADTNTSKHHEKAVADFKEKTTKVGVQFLSWTARLGIKAATLGLISASDIEAFQEMKNDLAKDASGTISKFIEERLTSHSRDIELLKSFQQLLSDLPKYLQKEDGKERPLVIIIDELDRCKPTYAVEVIEKIKHLFSVKNVVFVLVINKKQLEESIKYVYGGKIDAHSYLQKFISVETTIPKRIEDTGIDKNDIQGYCHRLLQLHEIETWGEDDELLMCIGSLAIHFNLSLRQLEKVFANLSLFYGLSEEIHLRLPPLIAFVCVIKVKNTSLFEEFLNNKPHAMNVVDKVGLPNTAGLPKPQELRDKGLNEVVQWIKFSYLSDTELQQTNENHLGRFERALGLSDKKRRLLVPFFCKKLNMFNIADPY